MKKYLVFLCSLTLLLGGIVTQASALLVTVNFQGIITSVDSSLAAQFNTTQTLSGSVTYDSLTSDTEPLSHVGSYVDALTDLTVNIDGYTATLGAPPQNWVTVVDAMPDIYSVRSDSMMGNPVNTIWSPGQFVMTQFDPAGTMFNSDAIPLTVPGLISTNPPRALFGFLNNGDRADVSAEITSWNSTTTPAPIPEPTTVLLLGTGLVGLVGLRKKFKK